MTTRRPKGTGSIYQRPDSGVFWMKYSRYGKAYRESTRTTDKTKAQKMLKTRLAEITTGQFVGPKAERIKVEELAEDFLREYRINGRKSLDDASTRWGLHLKPMFEGMRAIDVTSDHVSRYIDLRQKENASNATINREVAALKRMFRLGQRSTPPKVTRMPYFPNLKENNVRKGFLEDSHYRALVEGAELWFRTLVECGRTFGWRISELIGMKVEQVDLSQRVIRLAPGSTKNNEGREVFMTDSLHLLLTACIEGKQLGEAVFTRPNGKPVRSCRETWERACCKAGLGEFSCLDCKSPMLHRGICSQCSSDRASYTGLIFHDLRRTAARNLRRAGIAETVIMKIGGWRTRSVFERYAIVSRGDMVDAMQKLQRAETESQEGHVISHVANTSTSSTPPSRVN